MSRSTSRNRRHGLDALRAVGSLIGLVCALAAVAPASALAAGAETTTTIQCEPGARATGEETHCTVVVTDNSGTPSNPSGEVRFRSNAIGAFSEGECELAPAPGSSSASGCEVDYTPGLPGSGIHRLFASYRGDEGHARSQGIAELAVANLTATKVACDAATLASGQSTKCTVTVEDLATEGPAEPAGKVSFQSSAAGGFSDGGSCTLAHSIPGASSCSLTYTPSAAGAHKLTTSYAGEAIHIASAGTAALTLVATTTASIACAPAPALVGAASTCVATVADAGAAPTSPAGTVSFGSDGQGVFSAPACALVAAPGGKASCQVTYTPQALGTGTHAITATYGGEATHAPSTIGAALAVTQAPPDTLIKRKPRKKTAARTARFRFVSTQPGSTFQCKLDRKAFKACKAPFVVKRLKNGRHVFRVKAISAQGIADPTPAVFVWKVGKVVKKR